MKTEIKLIALFILIVLSLIIPHRGFSESDREKEVMEPLDMAKTEMVDILNLAYKDVFKLREFTLAAMEPEIMVFDFMDNLILKGDANDELIKKIVRCCDYLSTVAGTDMYKMNIERPIYKECKEILDL
jgi:hypothetical protein